MRKRWRMICRLAGMASLCWAGGSVMGQEYQAPQYPQYVQYPQDAPPVMPGVPAPAVMLTPSQLDQLIGPIALYPDPLLSLIFPAATYYRDVVAAEQWLQTIPAPTEAAIAAQRWDDSVKGLVHYPTVLQMMCNQSDWTRTLGAAFLSQQPDVLAAVQRLRAEARAAGNLQSTPQQQVVAIGGDTCIEPADPASMCVPYYDPNAVYFGPCPITFSAAWPIGSWCINEFDWRRHFLVHGGGWFNGWHHPEEWDRRWPGWDRRPAGWVAAPKPWVRAPLRPAPRLTSAVVSRLGLDRPRGAVAVNPGRAVRKLPPSLPIGKQPAPRQSNNIFMPANSRNEVQQDVQRTRSTPRATEPAPAPRPAPMPRPAPAPRVPAPAPAPRAPAPAPAPRAPAPAPQSAPAAGSAFSGGSGAAARAESNRGNTSARQR